MGPEFEKGDGRLRPSLQQRLPGAEGPPEGCATAPRHAACGGPLQSSTERRVIFCTRHPQLSMRLFVLLLSCGSSAAFAPTARTISPGAARRSTQPAAVLGYKVAAAGLTGAVVSTAVVARCLRALPQATMLSHSTFRRRMRPPTTRLTICTLRGAPRKMMASRESLEAERSRASASHDSLPACPWPPHGYPELEPRRRAWRG